MLLELVPDGLHKIKLLLETLPENRSLDTYNLCKKCLYKLSFSILYFNCIKSFACEAKQWVWPSAIREPQVKGVNEKNNLG